MACRAEARSEAKQARLRCFAATARHPSPVTRLSQTRLVYRAEARRRRAKACGPDRRQLEPRRAVDEATREAETSVMRRCSGQGTMHACAAGRLRPHSFPFDNPSASTIIGGAKG